MTASKPPRRKTARLGLCEYVSTDPKNSMDVWGARRELLEVVKRVYPQFLEELSTSVFPFYEKVAVKYDLDLVLWSPEVSAYEMVCTSQDWYVANQPLVAHEKNGLFSKEELEEMRIDAEEREEKLKIAIKDGDFLSYQEAMNRKDLETRHGWSKVQRDQSIENLKVAISNWAEKFNVEETWLKDGALRTMRDWVFDPARRKSIAWRRPFMYKATHSIGEVFEFRFDRWDTESCTWASYHASLDDAFRRSVSEYQQKTRNLAESRGLVVSHRTYSRDNFDWFALRIFARWSSTKIASYWTEHKNEDGVEESTVASGVEAARGLLKWEGNKPLTAKSSKTR